MGEDRRTPNHEDSTRAWRDARATVELELEPRAATVYGNACEALSAARALREVGDMSKALKVALNIASDSAEYPAAARLVIAIAAAHRHVGQELEDFLAPYVERDPEELLDQDAFFLFGQLYEVLGYTGLSQWLYSRLAQLNPLHPVHIHLRDQKMALEQATLETQASGADLEAVRRQLLLRKLPLNADAMEPGTVVAGRYVLEFLLGSGSTAAVYVALDLASGRKVALKLSCFSARDLLATRRFRREATLSMALVHPNIVRAFDAGQHEGHSFMAMELVEGLPLDVAMREGLLERPVAEKCHLLLQALHGLEHAHAMGISHRDIKPENMLISVQGVLKLTDFGLAKGIDEDRITASGIMGGTPSYISPEQIVDIARADGRSDLYSLGCVAYELLTGQPPFEAAALTELLMHHLNRQPPSLRSLKPSVPEALDHWVLTLLRKRPDERYQTCAEAAQGLRGFRWP